MANVMRGLLVEYALALPPLAISFDFNPKTLRRTRTVTVSTSQSPAARGGYDFALPTEASRAAQGVSMEPEHFSISILIDATDKMNEGDEIASQFGVQPQIDTLRSMVEPKAKGPGGVQLLASLGLSTSGALASRDFASVIIFVWGARILPVFLTSVEIEEQAHLPSLFPYRAEASISMQVIESSNPFYALETMRQVAGSATNTTQLGAEAITGLF